MGQSQNVAGNAFLSSPIVANLARAIDALSSGGEPRKGRARFHLEVIRRAIVRVTPARH